MSSRPFLCLTALTLAFSMSPLTLEAGESSEYSPYAGRDYPTQVYWGDTHLHSANSGDAFTNGNRLLPEQAYRFARGEEIISASGIPVKLSRPLDFLVVSDHAEGLGITAEVYAENPVFMSDPTLKRWSGMMKAGGKQALEAQQEIVRALATGTLPPPVQNPKIVGPVIRSVWQAYTEMAERYNEPGRFTAMIGYEWTSVPGGDNLHRNVLLRDGKDKADQVLPFSSMQSQDPEKLWAWMAKYEQKTGGRMLAIPHNANLSNGRMFELQTFEGEPLTTDYAKRRQRWEPLQELIQTKGNSETHPLLAPNDEFADYGVAGYDLGNLNLQGSPETPEMRPYTYLREGLKRGLEQESKLGVNPFRFGFIGSSDSHTSLATVAEENFFGKRRSEEPSAGRWSLPTKKGLGMKRYVWQIMSAGYAAVWARDNTREDLWDSLESKEVYATSGTRITVRFFGGWSFSKTDADQRDIARTGYEKGVPMGGDLNGADRDKASAPVFLLAAMKDPMSANLDRIQVIKGWLDKDGKTHEKIYDVVWGDANKRALDANGSLAPVGSTVNLETVTWTDTIGDPGLSTVWTDPDFDPSQPAFYYARVIEIPTPTWMAYDRQRLGAQMSEEVPMTHQERAWTSPIWYTP